MGLPGGTTQGGPRRDKRHTFFFRALNRLSMDESELIAGLRQGRPGAVAQAYALHHRAVYAFLLRLCRRVHTAEDLLQETFLRLSRHQTRLHEDTRLLAWLFTVARNLYRSHLRWSVLDLGRLFDGGDAELELAQAHGASPEQVTETRSELARVERAIGQVSPGAREVLLLLGVQQLSPEDVQQVLGVSAEALRQRVSRARKELRERLSATEQP